MVLQVELLAMVLQVELLAMVLQVELLPVGCFCTNMISFTNTKRNFNTPSKAMP